MECITLLPSPINENSWYRSKCRWTSGKESIGQLTADPRLNKELSPVIPTRNIYNSSMKWVVFIVLCSSYRKELWRNWRNLQNGMAKDLRRLQFYFSPRNNCLKTSLKLTFSLKMPYFKIASCHLTGYSEYHLQI